MWAFYSSDPATLPPSSSSGGLKAWRPERWLLVAGLMFSIDCELGLACSSLLRTGAHRRDRRDGWRTAWPRPPIGRHTTSPAPDWPEHFPSRLQELWSWLHSYQNHFFLSRDYREFIVLSWEVLNFLLEGWASLAPLGSLQSQDYSWSC